MSFDYDNCLGELSEAHHHDSSEIQHYSTTFYGFKQSFLIQYIVLHIQATPV